MANVSYSRVNWEDSPSTNTPINADNLNKMDKGVSECATKINNISDDLSDFSFRNNNGTAQYSLDGGSTWKNFSQGAVLIGTYSSNTTINVSAYGATSASQFVLVPRGNASNHYEREIPTSGSVCYMDSQASFTNGNLSLSGNTLTVTLPTCASHSVGREPSGYICNVAATATISCKLYFIG